MSILRLPILALILPGIRQKETLMRVCLILRRVWSHTNDFSEMLDIISRLNKSQDDGYFAWEFVQIFWISRFGLASVLVSHICMCTGRHECPV